MEVALLLKEIHKCGPYFISNSKNIFLLKPDVYKKKIKINMGKTIENKFVVGYSLDYNEIGRNLVHIYN